MSSLKLKFQILTFKKDNILFCLTATNMFELIEIRTYKKSSN